MHRTVTLPDRRGFGTDDNIDGSSLHGGVALDGHVLRAARERLGFVGSAGCERAVRWEIWTTRDLNGTCGHTICGV